MIIQNEGIFMWARHCTLQHWHNVISHIFVQTSVFCFWPFKVFQYIIIVIFYEKKASINQFSFLKSLICVLYRSLRKANSCESAANTLHWAWCKEHRFINCMFNKKSLRFFLGMILKSVGTKDDETWFHLEPHSFTPPFKGVCDHCPP